MGWIARRARSLQWFRPEARGRSRLEGRTIKLGCAPYVEAPRTCFPISRRVGPRSREIGARLQETAGRPADDNKVIHALNRHRRWGGGGFMGNEYPGLKLPVCRRDTVSKFVADTRYIDRVNVSRKLLARDQQNICSRGVHLGI